MALQIFFWVILIHVIEIAAVAFYFLIKKNSALEKAYINKQQQLDAAGIIITRMDSLFKQLDSKVWVNEDEELTSIFSELKEAQSILTSIK